MYEWRRECVWEEGVCEEECVRGGGSVWGRGSV